MTAMLGALIGDFIGSRFEFREPPEAGFEKFHPDCRFTDDSILTAAVADALSDLDAGEAAFASSLRRRFVDAVRRRPEAGWGESFLRWARAGGGSPYGSFGNGSAMRVSPVAWALSDREAVRRTAALSAAVTHSHPEGIAGAVMIADAVFLARSGERPEAVQRALSLHSPWRLNRTWAEYASEGPRPDETCRGCVPQALACVWASGSFEEAVERAVLLGGDADTTAALAGSVAEALFGIPRDWAERVMAAAEASDPELARSLLRFEERRAGQNRAKH